MNTTELDPNPATEQEKQPFAILYLPEAKSGQSLMIYGRSGVRYQFQPVPSLNNRPARVYYDPALFEREERDLRRNLKQVVVVCTSIGSLDPATRVSSALEQLIGSRQSIGAGAVRDELEKLSARVAEALEALDADCPNTKSAQTSAATTTTPVSASAETQQAATTVGEEEDTSPIPVLNQPSLWALAIEELRALAKRRNVKGRSRKELVDGILLKQQEEAGA